MSLVFFDVETPNRLHDRVCSIAAIRTDEGLNVEYKKFFLVNPEAAFDRANIRVHGLSARDVVDAPTFGELWDDELRSVFSGSVVVAHNAAFDLSVVDKALSQDGFVIPDTEYVCTLRAAQYSGLESNDYRLPTLCSIFGIDLGTHHDALCDAVGCLEVFREMQDRRMVDLFCTSIFRHSDYMPTKAVGADANVAAAMTDLYGLALGVTIDKKVRPEEHCAFEDWMTRYAAYARQPFFKDAFALIEAVLDDGVISPEEQEQILGFARPFLNACVGCESTRSMQELMGLIRGIGADRQINVAEASGLRSWMSSHESLHDDKTFVKVFSMLEDVLADGFVSAEEEEALLEVFDSIINPEVDGNGAEIAGKSFCLTGDFLAGSKKDVAAAIEANGGMICNGVSKKVDYVVVGGKGSDQYAFGGYGTKVKKAMELQDAGCPIQVIHEEALNLAVGEMA